MLKHDVDPPHRPAFATVRRSPAPVRRFLRLWQTGSPPDLVAFLDHEGELEPTELAAVLRADQRHRWRAGIPLSAEWYFERFPGISSDADLALDLIHNEFMLREALEEAVDLQEFVVRFPRVRRVDRGPGHLPSRSGRRCRPIG